MRRREFLAGLLATTTGSALRAAEPKKVYRLAVCFFRPQAGTPMVDRLRQLGYAEGKNLIVDRYVPEGHDFAEIARNMVQTNPDVIVLGNSGQHMLAMSFSEFDPQRTSQFALLIWTLIVAGHGRFVFDQVTIIPPVPE